MVLPWPRMRLTIIVQAWGAQGGAGMAETKRVVDGIWRAVLRLLVAASLVSVALVSARADDAKPLRGVALVIGNGDYKSIARLANPVNDARAIEDLLHTLGFETTMASDRDARRLRRDLEGFVEDAEGADVAVVYYSGHGIEVPRHSAARSSCVSVSRGAVSANAASASPARAIEPV